MPPCPKATPDPKCAVAVGAPEDLRRCARAVPRLVAPFCRLGVQLMRIFRQLGDSFQMISEGVLCFKTFCWIILIPSSIFCWEQPLYRLEKIPAKEYGGFPPESNYLFLGA